jgi:hypothetical protein
MYWCDVETEWTVLLNMKEHKGLAPMKTRRFWLMKIILSLVGIRTPDAPPRSLATIPPTVSQLPGRLTPTTKPKVNRTGPCAAILVEMHPCATRKTHYLLAVNIISTSHQPTVEHKQDTETTPREADRYSDPWKPNKDMAIRITLAISNGTFYLYTAIIRLQ